MFRTALLALSCLLAPAALAHEGPPGTPPWQDASAWPDRIVVTPGADPTTSFAVNWRTDASVEATEAELVPASPDARFDLAATPVPARSETLDPTRIAREGREALVEYNAGLTSVRYHSVVFDELEPDTLYAYRVRGAEDVWSEWFQVRTAPTEGPIEFLYVGDAQNGILSHWSRVVRGAFRTNPEARFFLHAGDLVNRGARDLEWAQWFKAVGFIHGMIPAIPVAGNHEYDSLGLPEEDRRRMLSMLWRPQFTLPETPELPAQLQETVYTIRYGSALQVFVLDTMGGDLEAQARWLDAGLRESEATWRVVSMHHPIFSSGRNRDTPERRALLLPVLLRHEVDLVLQGHDHTYARGGIAGGPGGPERTAAGTRDALATMFVNSVSGAKQYEFKEGGWDDYADEGVRLERMAENSQFYQAIRIDGSRLEYRAYTADGELYDEFAAVKDEAGRKRVVTGREARRFENTMPYPGANGLNLD